MTASTGILIGIGVFALMFIVGAATYYGSKIVRTLPAGTPPGRQRLLHVGVAIALTATAVAIYHYVKLDFFRGIILGSGLMWIGGKLLKASYGPAKPWGNILRGIGGVVILISVWQSGIRHAAEKSVAWVDTSLTELATGEKTTSLPKSIGRKDVAGNGIVVDLRTAKVDVPYTVEMTLGDTLLVRKPITQLGDVPIWQCFQPKGMAASKVELVASSKGNYTMNLVLSDESVNTLYQEGVMRVNIIVKLARSYENPCPGDIL